MGYLDGELGPEEQESLENHLAVCVACRGEETAYRQLGKVTEEMAQQHVSVSSEVAWAGIYGQIERRVGWILLSLGALVLIGFGAWHLTQGFFLSSDVPLVARLGLGALLAGTIVLLISFGRETLFRHRTERYREVQR